MKFGLISILFFAFFGCIQISNAQSSAATAPDIIDPEFDKTVDELISYSVPTVSVTEIKNWEKGSYIFLDAREKSEYNISHIPGAKYIGYDHVNQELIDQLSTEQTIVLYCSVGYRSEKVGEIFQRKGFKEVYNLYGSIFEWVNQGNPVVDQLNQPTKKIHTYNKSWSKWLLNPEYVKVW